MKTFLLKSIFLVLLVAISIKGVCLLVSSLIRNPNVYIAGTIDKENRLRNTRSPRIILVGGSNIAFGIDSKSIEAAFHRDVIDMSMHAGLGLAFPLNESLDGIRDSDIVILSTEYYLDKPDMKLLPGLLDVNPNARKYVSLQPLDLIPFYIGDLQRCVSGLILKLGKRQDSIYTRSAFSPEGDVISHLGKKNIPIKPPVIPQTDYTANLKLINAYIDSVKKRNATIYYLFPTCQQSTYILNQKSIENFAGLMTQNLHCQVINTPLTFVYSDSLYFNTEYHLNQQGRALRTNKTIEILQGFIPR